MKQHLARFMPKLLKVIGKKIILITLHSLNHLMRTVTAATHRLQFYTEYHVFNTPESFDHFIDLYYLWRKQRYPIWLERGIFGLLTCKDQGDVLELCCGDGFNARNFYPIRAKSIVAVDFERDVIRFAQKYNSAPNIRFLTADIRYAMPQGVFDTIIWDAAIEHFTETEIYQLLNEIKPRLKDGGYLSGYTIVEKTDGSKSHSLHEYEFKSKEDLLRFFSPHFKNVKVFETVYPIRHNLYFWASDDTLPFDEEWHNQIRSRSAHTIA